MTETWVTYRIGTEVEAGEVWYCRRALLQRGSRDQSAGGKHDEADENLELHSGCCQARKVY